MTSMPAPDYCCQIDLSEKEFRDLAGFQWKVDIFHSTSYKPVKGNLIIPEGGRFIKGEKQEAWLWIEFPSVKTNKDTILSVSIIGLCAWEKNSKNCLIKQFEGKKISLDFVE
jgi:hypothetical protein